MCGGGGMMTKIYMDRFSSEYIHLWLFVLRRVRHLALKINISGEISTAKQLQNATDAS